MSTTAVKFLSGLQDLLGLYDSATAAANHHASSSSSSFVGISASTSSSFTDNSSLTPPSTPKRTSASIGFDHAVSASTSNGSANTVDDPISRCSHDRTVHFPADDHLVSDYYESRKSPFYDDISLCDAQNPQQVLSVYNQACIRHAINPCAKVERQIGFFHKIPRLRQESLSLKGEHLTNAHMECLEEIFRRLQFDQLDFEYTFLDDDTAVALAEMLEYYDSALKLNLSFNQQIRVRGWQAIFRMLKNTTSLQSLNLRYTSLNERTIPMLARSLRCQTSLTCLHMENCSLSGKSLLLIVCALKANMYLRELYLGDNSLGPSDGAHLYQLITNNTSIQMLDLRNNNLQDAGVRHICDALRNPDSFRSGCLSALVLWNNRMTSASMDSLARALLENTKLETLNIGSNCLSVDGISHLKHALVRNQTLQRLGLQSTKLNCQCAIELAECIADNPTLVRVDLRDNPDIRSAGLLALHLAMKMNTGITLLNLDQTCYQPTSSSKVREYADQFKQYFDEIKLFCERNKVAALKRLSVQSTTSVTDDDTAEDEIIESTLPNEEEEEECQVLVSINRKSTSVDGGASESVVNGNATVPVRPVYVRSSSLTCNEIVDDIDQRVQLMTSPPLISKPPNIDYSSDDDRLEMRPRCASLPSISPIEISIGRSGDGGGDANRRFSVSPTNSPIRSPTSPRFHVAAVRPDSLRISSNASKIVGRNSDSPLQIDAAVRTVVADLVNFCAYEMDEQVITPSVNRSYRSSPFRFAANATTKNCATASHSTDSEAKTTAVVVVHHETNSEIEEAVTDTMRTIVKGVILFERDTLRRSVGKKRKKLSKTTLVA